MSPSAPAVRVLVVDDEPGLRRAIVRTLTARGFDAVEAHDGAEALERMRRGDIDVLLADLVMPGVDGLQLLRGVRAFDRNVPVVIMTAYADVPRALEAQRAGAFNFLRKPFGSEDDIVLPVRAAAEHASFVRKDPEGIATPAVVPALGTLVGGSEPMQDVYRTIRAVAPGPSSVLILGESGTGKELVAQEIHRLSPRGSKTFVPVNVGAMTNEMVNDEFFGHKKGAHTGAIADRPGLFESADGGTIFLDEIGDLHVNLQVSLLRVLESREVRRGGENTHRKVNVRVIAATNKDLWTEVEARRFREDLFFRLNVVAIRLPPLRNRVEDIPALATHLLQKISRDLGKDVRTVDPRTLTLLRAYPWPGNVRELLHAIERGVNLAAGSVLTPEVLPEAIRAGRLRSSNPAEARAGESMPVYEPVAYSIAATPPLASPSPAPVARSLPAVGMDAGEDFGDLGYNDAKNLALARFERAYITWAMRRSDGVISRAAERAKLDRSNFKRVKRRVDLEFQRERTGEAAITESDDRPDDATDDP